jgi:hypothetical protein
LAHFRRGDGVAFALCGFSAGIISIRAPSFDGCVYREPYLR